MIMKKIWSGRGRSRKDIAKCDWVKKVRSEHEDMRIAQFIRE